MLPPENDAVRTEARKLLDLCGILTPPTDFSTLLEARQLNLFDLPDTLASELPSNIREAIRAAIDIPERNIFISPLLRHKPKRFASFHEIGHDTIPWHRDLLKYNCSELDLSPQARKQFDIEANLFAAECLFQGDRFIKEALDYRFALKPILTLAETYDISYESAIRRYVEQHPESCALLVCETEKKILQFEPHSFQIKYLVRSSTFPKNPYERGLKIAADNIIPVICNRIHKKPIREKTIIHMGYGRQVKCISYFFFNGYRALILMKEKKFTDAGHEIYLVPTSPKAN